MFFPEGSVKVFYYAEPVDMRKSFSGLYALAKHVLKEDPLSGHLFVFCNRERDYVKCLYFDRTGFCIWAKRLERGCYLFPAGTDAKRELSFTDFKLVLEGLEIKRRYKRFTLPQAEQSL